MQKLSLNLGLIAVTCISLIGCGGGASNTGPKRFPISGEVTFDGKPLETGSVKFVSAPGVTPAVYAGSSISNGHFSLQGQSGLPIGKYMVIITSSPAPEAPSQDPEAAMAAANAVVKSTELIPKKYNNQTGLTVDIVDGTNGPVSFDLKSKD